MTPDEIAALIFADSMPAIKLAMEAERQNGAAAEREACAQMCEALRPSEREFDKRYYDACTDCAEIIRGRSNP